MDLSAIERLMLDARMTCREGDTLFKAGKYAEAMASYWNSALKVVGPDYRIPGVPGGVGGGVRTELYSSMDPWERANLMGCCAGLAKCLLKEGDTESALAWLEEINALYKGTYFTTEKPLYDWIDFGLDLPELTYRRVVGLATSSDVFVSLSNTGAATHRRWVANTSIVNLPAHHKTSRTLAEANKDKVAELTQLRHPDPNSTNRLELKNPDLQVQGSWAKLPVKSPARVLARFAFASFTWKSRLYVAGGQQDSLGPFYRDFWYLDLEKLDAWRPLPGYPIPQSSSGAFLNWSMVVYNNKALLFTGRRQMDYFDLVTEKWGTIDTTYTPTRADEKAGVGKWPWPGQRLSDSAQQIVGDKLLVFGGVHRDTNIGCNLFMELDLKTNVWRRLTGHVMPPPDNDYSCPGPRKNPGSWVGKDKNRFYLLFGQCDRQGASLRKEPHGASSAYPYEDMWSWDVREEKWRRERFPGNSPCPRTELACAYNEKLGKVFIFGGYNPCLPTLVLSKRQQFEFSYFADTFMYTPPDPAAPPSERPLTSPVVADSSGQPKWKQVLTRGFPTYRCQARLSCDPETGKTYLFGGFTNTDYVPSRGDYISRSFGDVWQLKVNEPGGYFEGVDLEEEARTAKAGPWQRCFNCGDVGSWKKCGGICNGRAFFCNLECQKEGWKEHKRMHKCGKKT
ncbi:hypothetical protein LshimejAT787_0207410 [Lyophyllum shimeji]|uniref:MYND-type domain-containing protein n=1 Tax=Lyophyllum shimeji TaxID=47721 RepID=A0A9P3PGQ0_LYOSH|nr:hypothetical protein LshimejAT787_0207410 [Lyophyllum shimeji]